MLLAAEGRPDAFIDDMLDFYGQLGLPRSLTEMGLDEVDAATLRDIAANTTVAPKGAYLLVPVGAEAVIAAIEDIERRFCSLTAAAVHA